MRINKFLAKAGVDSRRACEKLVEQGRIIVNGKKICELSFQIEPDKDEVFLDKKRLTLVEKKHYILLNKPKGYICSNKDSFNKKKARDLINIKDRLFNIGRLDVNTEGLIIFTNDGDLSNYLTHPKYKIEKNYIVIINKFIKNEDIENIRKGGIELTEGVTLPANIEVLDKLGMKIKLGIFEGRKRQIRRVFRQLKYKVLSLKRISIGQIKLKDLKVGEYRNLTSFELNYLSQYKIGDRI